MNHQNRPTIYYKATPNLGNQQMLVTRNVLVRHQLLILLGSKAPKESIALTADYICNKRNQTNGNTTCILHQITRRPHICGRNTHTNNAYAFATNIVQVEKILLFTAECVWDT